MSDDDNDKRLGMDRQIDRRDFLNGVAVTVGALGLTGAGAVLAQAAPGGILGAENVRVCPGVR